MENKNRFKFGDIVYAVIYFRGKFVVKKLKVLGLYPHRDDWTSLIKVNKDGKPYGRPESRATVQVFASAKEARDDWEARKSLPAFEQYVV